MKQDIDRKNYWMSPTGKVWSTTKVGDHYNLGLEIIKQKYPDVYSDDFDDSVDFLESKGYIRYCSISGWMIYSGQRITKKQIDKALQLTGVLLNMYN